MAKVVLSCEETDKHGHIINIIMFMAPSSWGVFGVWVNGAFRSRTFNPGNGGQPGKEGEIGTQLITNIHAAKLFAPY